jgi:hypothetical protein
MVLHEPIWAVAGFVLLTKWVGFGVSEADVVGLIRGVAVFVHTGFIGGSTESVICVHAVRILATAKMDSTNPIPDGVASPTIL